jgi:mono/diheme cytochrome c family protein
MGQTDGKIDKELDEWVNTQLSFPDQRKITTPDHLLPLPVSQLKKLVNPYDKTNSLEARVKSYLHSNCANCHINAGGGNSQMDLDFFADKDKIKILDEKPNHHTFGFKDAKIIAPGDPERSVLLHRISIVGTGQMPQISRNLVDKQAVELFTEWIRSIPK